MKFKRENAFDARILKFISHHRYKPPRQYYDIALIELEDTVKFKWEVHPACLWTKFDNPDTGKLTGWGIVDSGTCELYVIVRVNCMDKLLRRKNVVRVTTSEEFYYTNLSLPLKGSIIRPT